MLNKFNFYIRIIQLFLLEEVILNRGEKNGEKAITILFWLKKK